MSLGSRTPSAGTTAGVGMGVVTAVVGVTVEVSATRIVTVSLEEAVEAGVVTTGSVVGTVVTTSDGSIVGIVVTTTGASVEGALVITTGASAGGIVGEVTSAVAGGVTGLVRERVRLPSHTIAPYMRSLNSSAACISSSTLSSSVMSSISESNLVRVLSFSSRLNLRCAKRIASGSSSATRASIALIVCVAEPLWPPLILRFRIRAAASATRSIAIVYFRSWIF